MFEVLLKTIGQKVLLSQHQQEHCKTFFISKSIRKKQFLLQQGSTCKYTAFVEKGVLRSYTIDEKGSEHILQFAFEGWWISDIYAFLTGEPSLLNIEAVEDSELLLITHEGNEKMLSEIPEMERYFRKLTQNAMIALQRRLIGSMSYSAEEKYTRLLDSFPEIFQKVPQHMIASYLGITPETLSRIRKQISMRK